MKAFELGKGQAIISGLIRERGEQREQARGIVKMKVEVHEEGEASGDRGEKFGDVGLGDRKGDR